VVALLKAHKRVTKQVELMDRFTDLFTTLLI
jgi:hypothetical protein